MVVAIDGPAGAGKSTVARATARALGFTYLDSGAMYRAAALSLLENGGAASERAQELEIELGERVIANGHDVTEAIRTPEVSEAASRVATNEKVRAALVEKQRALLAEGDWVAEGRDIGTVVAPDAAVKVFLTADPARARPAPRRGAGRRRGHGAARPGAARRPGRGPRALAAAGRRRCAGARHHRPDRRPGGASASPSWSAPPARRERPKVAVVGYPNVGKSTLVNRLSETREAVVHEQAGVTRDRKEVEADWNGREFTLIDTGGVDAEEAGDIAEAVRRQARAAIAEADVAVLVVDARAGLRAGRRRAGAELRAADPAGAGGRQQGRRGRCRRLAAEFYKLGLGDPMPVSAAQGLGTGDLLDVIAGASARGRAGGGGDHAAGGDRPPQRRQVVAGEQAAGGGAGDRDRRWPAPPATRSTPVIEFEGRPVTLVDTAGLRRRTKVAGTVDYYAQLRSERAAERAAVAIVMCDASEGVTTEDFRIAEMAMKKKCATVIALNKWDVTRHRPRGRHRTRGDQAAPAPAGDGGVRARRARAQAAGRRGAPPADRAAERIQTAKLNRFLADVQAVRQPPATRGKRLKMYYAAQFEASPPRVAIQVNDRSLITRDYAYFVENRLREQFGLEGVPLVIDFKTSSGRRSRT